MKLKLIFGIIIPLIIIVTLSILGNLNIGFTVKEKYIQNIKFSDLFNRQNSNNQIELSSVEINNDYFLAKRYDLPPKIVCLIDNEKIKQNADIGSLYYSEGDINNNEFDPYYYRNNNYNVQVNSGKSKEIKTFAQSYNLRSYSYNYNLTIQNYRDYDKIVIVDNKRLDNYRSTSCYNLDEESLKDAISIPIIEIPENVITNQESIIIYNQ